MSFFILFFFLNSLHRTPAWFRLWFLLAAKHSVFYRLFSNSLMQQRLKLKANVRLGIKIKRVPRPNHALFSFTLTRTLLLGSFLKKQKHWAIQQIVALLGLVHNFYNIICISCCGCSWVHFVSLKVLNAFYGPPTSALNSFFLVYSICDICCILIFSYIDR